VEESKEPQGMPSMTLQEFETKIKGANGLLVVVDFTTIGGA